MQNYGRTTSPFRTLSGALLVVVALVSGGCSQWAKLQAIKQFKAANTAYAQQDYKEAVKLYEDALQANPDLNQVYFYLANSYDNLYRSVDKGKPENDAMMDKAVQHYQTSADKLANATDPNDKTLAQRSLEYLVAAYGADKLNQPEKAEPVVQKMIQMDPTNPQNYFALAKIYEDAAAYPEAEQMYLKAKEVRPNEPSVYTTLAGFYNRLGQFDKTIKALEERAEKEPTNPEAYQTIASYYWDEARNDPKLKDSEKKDFVIKGLAASDKAIGLKGDYVEAIVFKNLLLRQQALYEKDRSKVDALIKEADKLRDKAMEIQKKQASGVS